MDGLYSVGGSLGNYSCSLLSFLCSTSVVVDCLTLRDSLDEVEGRLTWVVAMMTASFLQIGTSFLRVRADCLHNSVETLILQAITLE